MKRHIVLVVCMVFAFATLYAQDAKKKKETVTFFVESMDCDHCVKTITDNISFEKGVTDLKCDLSKQTVKITFKPDKTSKTKLTKAFEKIKMKAVPVDKNAGCNKDAAKTTVEKDKKEVK